MEPKGQKPNYDKICGYFSIPYGWQKATHPSKSKLQTSFLRTHLQKIIEMINNIQPKEYRTKHCGLMSTDLACHYYFIAQLQ